MYFLTEFLVQIMAQGQGVLLLKQAKFKETLGICFHFSLAVLKKETRQISFSVCGQLLLFLSP